MMICASQIRSAWLSYHTARTVVLCITWTLAGISSFPQQLPEAVLSETVQIELGWFVQLSTDTTLENLQKNRPKARLDNFDRRADNAQALPDTCLLVESSDQENSLGLSVFAQYRVDHGVLADASLIMTGDCVQVRAAAQAIVDFLCVELGPPTRTGLGLAAPGSKYEITSPCVIWTDEKATRILRIDRAYKRTPEKGGVVIALCRPDSETARRQLSHFREADEKDLCQIYAEAGIDSKTLNTPPKD